MGFGGFGGRGGGGMGFGRNSDPYRQGRGFGNSGGFGGYSTPTCPRVKVTQELDLLGQVQPVVETGIPLSTADVLAGKVEEIRTEKIVPCLDCAAKWAKGSACIKADQHHPTARQGGFGGGGGHKLNDDCPNCGLGSLSFSWHPYQGGGGGASGGDHNKYECCNGFGFVPRDGVLSHPYLLNYGPKYVSLEGSSMYDNTPATKRHFEPTLKFCCDRTAQGHPKIPTVTFVSNSELEVSTLRDRQIRQGGNPWGGGGRGIDEGGSANCLFKDSEQQQAINTFTVHFSLEEKYCGVQKVNWEHPNVPGMRLNFHTPPNMVLQHGKKFWLKQQGVVHASVSDRKNDILVTFLEKSYSPDGNKESKQKRLVRPGEEEDDYVETADSSGEENTMCVLSAQELERIAARMEANAAAGDSLFAAASQKLVPYRQPRAHRHHLDAESGNQSHAIPRGGTWGGGW